MNIFEAAEVCKYIFAAQQVCCVKSVHFHAWWLKIGKTATKRKLLKAKWYQKREKTAIWLRSHYSYVGKKTYAAHIWLRFGCSVPDPSVFM